MNRRKFLGTTCAVAAAAYAPTTLDWQEQFPNGQWVHFYQELNEEFDKEGLVGKFSRRDKEYALGFIIDEHFDRKLDNLRFVIKSTMYRLDAIV